MGEVCGLAATASAATILGCRRGGGNDSTVLVSTDSDRVLTLPGIKGPQTAFNANRSTLWIPTTDTTGATASAIVSEVNLTNGDITPISAGDGVVISVATSGDQVFVGFGEGDIRTLLPTPTPVLSLSAPVRLLAAGVGNLWIVHSRGSVSLLDLETDETSANIAHLRGPLGASAVVANGELWVSGAPLTRVNSKGEVQAVDIPGSAVTNVASCGRRVWTVQKTLGAGYGQGSGLRALDANGKVIDTIAAPFPGYLACAGDNLWSATADGRLFKLKAS